MAVLPISNLPLENGVSYQEQTTRTFYVDRATKRVAGMCDGLEAMKQAVDSIVHVERFYWQIYSANFGMQWRGLIGRNPRYLAAVVQQRLQDAFSVDGRIQGISDFSYTVEGDKMTVSFVVRTVFGTTAHTADILLEGGGV